MNYAGLVEWHHAWRLEKNAVYCRRCGAVQHEQDEGNDFEHINACSALHLEQRPWCELKTLLKETYE
jgi:hypothetical protein